MTSDYGCTILLTFSFAVCLSMSVYFCRSAAAGQDMRHASSGLSPRVPPIGSPGGGLNNVDIGKRLLQRKQAELNKIIEQQRKLYTNLDSLDRQRSQILGDIDKTSVYRKLTSDMSYHLQQQQQQQGQSNSSRYSSQLRNQLPQNNMSSHFGPASTTHMHHVRGSPGNAAAAATAAAIDTLHGYPNPMHFLSNRPGMVRDNPRTSTDVPPPILDHQEAGGFRNMPPGYRSKASSAIDALGSLKSFHQRVSERDRFEAKLQEMEGNPMVPNGGGNHLPSSAANQHFEKRRRIISAAQNALHHGGAGVENSKLRGVDAQKRPLGNMGAKNYHGIRMSSSYLPSEIMVTPNNTSSGDSLSVLSSSHQLLMSQREANMQRNAQNLLFYQGMSNNMVPIPGLGSHRKHRQHDGKLPDTKRKLSKDFVPEVDTVVLGKGNIPKTNIGNLKLKGIVMDNLVEYANGERRKKIAVISRIINHVTAANYKTTGFVKFEEDVWWEMTERDARVKITALFRDCLHDQYRSSSSSKVKRRQELRKSKELSSNVNSAAATTTSGTTSVSTAATDNGPDSLKSNNEGTTNKKNDEANTSPSSKERVSHKDKNEARSKQ